MTGFRSPADRCRRIHRDETERKALEDMNSHKGPGGPRERASERNLLSLRDAADEVGVCVKTLRRWIADGRLIGYRLGPRAIRIDAAELRSLAQPLDRPNTIA